MTYIRPNNPPPLFAQARRVHRNSLAAWRELDVDNKHRQVCEVGIVWLLAAWLGGGW